MRALVAGRVPQPFQVANLLVSKTCCEALLQIWRAASWPRPAVAVDAGALRSCTLPGFVGRQDLPLALFAACRISASMLGPRPAIWLGSRLDRPGQLLLGQLAHAAVHEHVLEGGRHQVGRLRRAGKVLGIVLLVRVDDAAEWYSC